MKNYIIKILLFSIPLLAYFILVATVDPYNFFENSNIAQLKTKIAYKIDHVLWDCINYNQKKHNVVLLGDSRVRGFKNDCLNASEEEFFNMGFNGATFPEVFDAFWTISKNKNLKEVYIGMGFHEYSSLQNRNRYEEAISARSNFFLYALNKSTFKTIIHYVKGQLLGHHSNIKSKTKKNWEAALSFMDKSYYQNYNYPKKYLNELQKIANYCNDNSIKLVFFIPPNHTDIQELIKKNELTLEYQKFKQDLNSLGILYDLDVVSSITKNKNNYIDPYHIAKKEINDIICKKISSQNKH